MTEKTRKPEGPLIRADVVAVVREYQRDPFSFALRTAFIETADEYCDQWGYLLSRKDDEP